MDQFFGINGPFQKFGNILADMMIISLIWTVCSIPLVTIGASCTAAYYVMTRRVSDREGFILRDFFRSFKSNLPLSTGIWLLSLLVMGITVIITRNIELFGNMKMILLPLQICIGTEAVFISLYAYGVAARFEMDFKETLKTAFFLSNKHLITTTASLVLAVILAIACYLYPPLIIIAIGAFIYLHSVMLMHVFRKYRPELDRAPEQEGSGP